MTTPKLNSRFGFFLLLTLLLWAKSLFAYFVDFDLRLDNALQVFILLINPVATTMLFLSIFLFIRRTKIAYMTGYLIYLLLSILLFVNVVYYQEFTDFLTIDTILGAGKVAEAARQPGQPVIQCPRAYSPVAFLIHHVL